MVLARWQSENGVGIEHLVISSKSGEIVAEGVIVGDRGNTPYGVDYRLRCSADWSVRALQIHVVGGLSLSLVSDGHGEWKNGDGRIVKALDGCVDVDISATPFTNTLPIQRLKLNANERRIIRVVYIPIPTLQIEPVEQAYTCLKQDQRYLYEGLFRKFQTELEIDGDGLVKDYPSLFRRVI